MGYGYGDNGSWLNANRRQVFNDHADSYDATRRRLVPCFDRFYGAAVSALGLLTEPPRRILDLGAGTGILSARVAAAYPDVELVLWDGAPAMLEQARRILGERATYQLGQISDLPPGPWDAVVSALAIHHLHDDAKKRLFADVHKNLARGGVFVNAEQVAGPSPLFDELNRRWHSEESARLGSSPEEWAGAEDRMRLDQCSTVERQLAWLRAGGFSDCDCVFKDHRFAVIVARRSG